MKKTTKTATTGFTAFSRFKNREINVGLLALFALASLVLNVLFAFRLAPAPPKKENRPSASVAENSICLVRYHTPGNPLIGPLLLAEPETESKEFAQLRSDLCSIIKDDEKEGDIQSVSVYVKDFNSSGWMGLGSETGYYPGSLMKVPVLLYYLKQEEEKPGYLKTVLTYNHPNASFPSQNYKGDSIRQGHKYTIAELLEFMITESDNNAAFLLTSQLDFEKYYRIFTDMGLPVYDPRDTRYSISAREYSKFFRVLYNATYLRKDLSEYGLHLLSHCNFGNGLVHSIPKSLTVAHKFGERGFDYEMDFSESGIFYQTDNPYLLTVMTRGRNITKQTSLVEKISSRVYRFFSNQGSQAGI